MRNFKSGALRLLWMFTHPVFSGLQLIVFMLLIAAMTLPFPLWANITCIVLVGLISPINNWLFKRSEPMLIED